MWLALLLAGGLIAAGALAAVAPKVENPHGRFKDDCALCHGASGWKPAKISPQFNHAQYGFPLSGAHATAKCMACHSSLDFTQGKALCASCHQDPHRGEMGSDCARCHSARSFQDRSAMVRQHQSTRFPLTGSHAQIDCEGCHKPTAQGRMQFVGTKAECQNCHMDQYRSTKNPDHVAGGFPTDCASCHTTLTWGTKSFDHDKTGFPLTGAHRTTPCQQCHGDGVYKGKTTDCYGCHKQDYDGASSPVHAAAGFPTACLKCHTTASWVGASFNHNTQTQFPLTGAHTSAQCSACHADGVYKGKATACYSCHKTDFDGTADPKHSAAAFATACEGCHTTANWTGATFNHTTQTTFPLTGAHGALDCNQCHGDNLFKGKSTLCYSCHQADYSGANNPAHASAGFPTTCETCHGTTNWTSATFDHNKSTTFPLTGAHVSAACNQCHGDGVYQGKSKLCYSCHADKFATPVVNHAAAAFATTCESCHTTTAWNPGTFNHTTQTAFPLTGAHQALACTGCHGDNVFKGKSALCVSCHQTDFNNTTDPKHTAATATFVSTCQDCHSTTVWTGSAFDHTAKTTFPLTGAHVALDCNSCHGDNVYKGKSVLCYSCHQADYTGTTNPAHAAGGFPTTCETCHGTTNWTSSTFNHNTSTTFPLTGAHQAVACNSCHGDGVYKGKSTLCYSCHADKYATPVLNHAAAAFATTCESCHTTTAWNPGTFNHTTQTTFPLTGAHPVVACNQCHGDNVFKGKSTLCYSCHQADYTGATNPAHASAGFPTTCETCHSTTNWTSSTFNHNTSTTFPLTGAHQAVACSGCHGDNVYKGKSTLCYSCHADKYATPVLNHAAAAFATTCESCHNTTAWNPGTFNHTTQTTFPLTGAHPAVACSGCHGDNVFKGKSTLCYSCHQTDYSGTNAPPHAASGIGTACESCHTTTDWGSGTFNHNTSTTFPLTGAHQAVACSGCHGDGVYKGKSTLCYSCHADKYTTTVLNHTAAAFPTTCENCHNTTAWNPGTFNHTTQTTFPLTGAHPAVACSGCHGDNVYKGKSTLCYSCHQTDYTGTTNPPHASGGFPTACETCHSTSNWTSATFDHNTATSFPLTGAHMAVACNGCHGDNVYKGKSTLCYSCHQTDYTGATNPAHATAGFPTACETCHSTTNWTSSTWSHNTSTTFPLTGSHVPLACNQCHGDNVFKGKSTLCYSCHKTDYSTPVLNHTAAAFATTCENCHNTTAWNPGTFNHTTSTTFPLTGAHITLSCNQCHGDNVFKGKSTLCYACHKSDYDGTTNPIHSAASFPTTCESCHTTTAWTGATFNHDSQYFKIYSGRHLGKWSACADCHASATNFAIFNCYGACHSVASVDRQHVGRSGYVQGAGDNNKCYSCHRSV